MNFSQVLVKSQIIFKVSVSFTIVHTGKFIIRSSQLAQAISWTSHFIQSLAFITFV
jgi:hypothetical protein